MRCGSHVSAGLLSIRRPPVAHQHVKGIQLPTHPTMCVADIGPLLSTAMSMALAEIPRVLSLLYPNCLLGCASDNQALTGGQPNFDQVRLVGCGLSETKRVSLFERNFARISRHPCPLSLDRADSGMLDSTVSSSLVVWRRPPDRYSPVMATGRMGHETHHVRNDSGDNG